MHTLFHHYFVANSPSIAVSWMALLLGLMAVVLAVARRWTAARGIAIAGLACGVLAVAFEAFAVLHPFGAGLPSTWMDPRTARCGSALARTLPALIAWLAARRALRRTRAAY